MVIIREGIHEILVEEYVEALENFDPAWTSQLTRKSLENKYEINKRCPLCHGKDYKIVDGLTQAEAQKILKMRDTKEVIKFLDEIDPQSRRFYFGHSSVYHQIYERK